MKAHRSASGAPGTAPVPSKARATGPMAGSRREAFMATPPPPRFTAARASGITITVIRERVRSSIGSSGRSPGKIIRRETSSSSSSSSDRASHPGQAPAPLPWSLLFGSRFDIFPRQFELRLAFIGERPEEKNLDPALSRGFSVLPSRFPGSSSPGCGGGPGSCSSGRVRSPGKRPP